MKNSKVILRSKSNPSIGFKLKEKVKVKYSPTQTFKGNPRGKKFV